MKLAAEKPLGFYPEKKKFQIFQKMSYKQKSLNSKSAFFAMTRIKRPPRDVPPHAGVYSAILEDQGGKYFSEYMAYSTPIDSKGRYEHYDTFRHKIPEHLNHSYVWEIIRLARNRTRIHFSQLETPDFNPSYNAIPNIQKTISFVDRFTTTLVLKSISDVIGEKQKMEYLLNDLTEDEAISSSQLEGAATTTLVAKKLLQSQRTPRSADEKMIVGNLKMLNKAWNLRKEPLSIDLIQQLHLVGVEGIDDDKYKPGTFRITDDVVVVGNDNEIVHTPPKADTLPFRIENLCDWVNQCHDSSDIGEFIHPLVKAIVLHFMIGYEHPFHDGNGRVARALFYWLMFKNEYTAFRYISISLLLKKARISYSKSYLYTETDGDDLTYFIDYQCSIILRAVQGFLDKAEQVKKEVIEFDNWLYESGVLTKLKEKQRIVFQVAKAGNVKFFTANNVAHNLNCAYNTAKTTLDELVAMNLFGKRKYGRTHYYFMLDKKEIQDTWL